MNFRHKGGKMRLPLSTTALARLLQIKETQIGYALRNGRLPRPLSVGNRLIWQRDDILRAAIFFQKDTVEFRNALNVAANGMERAA